MIWRIERVQGLVLVRCDVLSRVPGIAHAFSTRVADGTDTFDLSVQERRKRFLTAAGLPGEATDLRQVHGDRVVRAATCVAQEPADASIWVSGDPVNRAPSIRFADCVPVLIADRRGRAVAAVHAGWRGTAAGIALRAVGALEAAGIEPGDLIAALGPAILACCYEVGDEVARALPESASGTRVDLHDANRRQLVRAGIPEAAVHAAPWCTKCRPDLFFSHRRDAEGAGRMMASVGFARNP